MKAKSTCLLLGLSIVSIVSAEPPVIVETPGGDVVVPVPPSEQVEVPAERVVVEGPFGPKVVLERLRIAPRVIEIPAPVEGVVRPARIYDNERNVVVVENRELPFVSIPVLFKKETAELLSDESRLALRDTAGAIQEILATTPNAVFEIEGHTSVEGTEEFNLKLSGDRAKRVFDELTSVYNVPAAALTAKGYGEQYVKHPDDAPNWPLDRRVLVVRVR